MGAGASQQKYVAQAPEGRHERISSLVGGLPSAVSSKILQKTVQHTQHVHAIADLCDAASRGDVDMVSEVLKSDSIHANSTDYDRRTPLHLAASEGHLDLVLMLLDKHDADRNCVDRWGGTPLDDATRFKHTACVSAMVERGCKQANTATAGATRLVPAIGSPFELKPTGLVDQADEHLLRLAIFLAAGKPPELSSLSRKRSFSKTDRSSWRWSELLRLSTAELAELEALSGPTYKSLIGSVILTLSPP
jgi:hypothetical protein